MNRQSYRLPAGGRIDRARPLRFRFNGTAYQGYMGDTLASALLANDVHLIGRSFKLHRPRGVVGAGVEDASGLVQLGEGARTEPNMRAAQIALYDGLAAASANCWPSVRFDLAAAFDRVSRLLPPGFYYKTFMSPRRLWPAYERVIRRAAGIGRAPAAPDPDRYEHANIHCDVMVVGGGPRRPRRRARRGPHRRAGHPRRRTERIRRRAARRAAGDRRTRRRRVDCPGGCRARGDGRGGAASARHGHGPLRPQLPDLPRAGRRPPAAAGTARRAAPAPMARSRSPGGARRRRHRAAPGVRRQRPPRRHARLGGPDLRQPLRGAARLARRGVHQQRQRLRRGGRPRRGRRRRAGHRRSARRPRRARRRPGARRRDRDRRRPGGRRYGGARPRAVGHGDGLRMRPAGASRARREGSTATWLPCPAAGARPCICGPRRRASSASTAGPPACCRTVR